MAEVTLAVETITPAKARQWLGMNIGNRPVRQAAINAYARDMAAKKWAVTGDPIKFNGERLVDGQHRLLACDQADTPFESAVARGVADAAHVAIDGGRKRTTGDELAWRGDKNSASTAAMLTLLWKWENNALSDPRQAPSKIEICESWEADKEACGASVAQARKLWTATRVPASPAAALHLRLARVWDSEIADGWFRHLISGVDYEEGDPAIAVRSYALRVQSVRALRPTTVEWLALLIKGTNAHLVGQPIRTVRWRAAGPAAEQFPELLNPEDLD